MGLESASVLGNLMLHSTSRTQIPAILRLYNQLRLPRTEIVRGASKKLGELWHMPDGPVCDARDQDLLHGDPSIGFPNLLADPCFQTWLWSYDPKKEARIAFEEHIQRETSES